MSEKREQYAETTQEIETEAAEAAATQSPIAAEPSFFRRKWVRITGAVLAALALLGAGIAIGVGIGDRHEERAVFDSFEHDAESGGRGEGSNVQDSSGTEPVAASDAAELVAAIDTAVAEVDGLGATSIEIERGGWEVDVLTADGKEIEVLVREDGTVAVGRSSTAGSDPVLDTAQVPAIVDAAIAAAGDGTIREISTDDSATVSFEVAVRTSAGRTVDVELAKNLSVVSVDD